jgi:serine/threonine protein kinase
MSESQLAWVKQKLGFAPSPQPPPRQTRMPPLPRALGAAIADEKAKIEPALVQLGNLRTQVAALRAGLQSNPAFILPDAPDPRATEDKTPVRSTKATAPKTAATPTAAALPEADRKALLDNFFAEKRSLSVQLEGISEASISPIGDLRTAQDALQQLGSDIENAKQRADQTGRRNLEALARDLTVAQVAAVRATEVTSQLRDSRIAFRNDLNEVSARFLKDFATRFQQIVPEASPKSLQKAADAEEKVFQTALSRYKKDAADDAKFSTEVKPGKPRTFEKIDLGKLLPADQVDKILSPNLQDADVGAVAENLAASVAKAFKDLPADSDQLFDLSLKGADDFKDAIAKSLGVEFEPAAPLQRQPETWDPPGVQAAAGQIADRLSRQVRDSNPTRISDDLSTVTFKNKKYSRGEELGGGSSNVATLYKDKDGNAVVLRTSHTVDLGDVKAPTFNRRSDVDDLVKHRMASGSDGIGAENVVKLLDVAQATESKVFGIFECCGGGDAKTFAQGTHAATETDVLPPTVRNAMIREMVGETAKGMKNLSDQGLAHNDFKTANVFLAADGTMKVGDLGETSPVDAQGKAPPDVTGGTAPLQASPSDKPSLQRDVGMMGTFLDMLASDVDSSLGGGRRRPGGAGALKRLRDAMLDPDPAKRPTIEAILLSAYVDEAEDSSPDPNLGAVKTALIAYSKKVAKDIAGPLKIIGDARQKIKESWEKDYKDAQKYKKHTDLIKEQNAIIEAQQKEIDKINKRADVAPLVDKIRSVSAAVEGAPSGVLCKNEKCKKQFRPDTTASVPPDFKSLPDPFEAACPHCKQKHKYKKSDVLRPEMWRYNQS